MKTELYKLLADITIKTNILPENWGIGDILSLILNIVLYGLGAAATIGVVIAGIQYLTARDNESQVAAAKKRLVEVVIGLIAWAAMFTLLRLLIPGFSSSKLGI